MSFCLTDSRFLLLDLRTIRLTAEITFGYLSFSWLEFLMKNLTLNIFVFSKMKTWEIFVNRNQIFPKSRIDHGLKLSNFEKIPFALIENFSEDMFLNNF